MNLKLSEEVQSCIKTCVNAPILFVLRLAWVTIFLLTYLRYLSSEIKWSFIIFTTVWMTWRGIHEQEKQLMVFFTTQRMSWVVSSKFRWMQNSFMYNPRSPDIFQMRPKNEAIVNCIMLLTRETSYHLLDCSWINY